MRGQITPKPQDTPLGGRGSCRAPCVLSRAGAQQELRPPVMACKPGGSSPQAACFAPAPSRSRLVVDRVVRGAALPGGPRETKGTFTPHPRPLSPSRGEGCRAMISGLSPSYTGCNSPVSNRHLIRVHSCPFVVPKTPLHSCPFVFIRGSKTPLQSCPFVVPKHPSIGVHSWFKTAEPKGAVTPHPRPLSPARGEGCQVVISG